MKPLEPGCLAVVVQSQNPVSLGKVVKCVRVVAPYERITYHHGGTHATGTNRCKDTVWLVIGDVASVIGVYNRDAREHMTLKVDSIYIEGNEFGNAIFSPEQLMRIDGFDPTIDATPVSNQVTLKDGKIVDIKSGKRKKK